MYFPYFMAYMTAGFTLSLVVFLWALRNGQFSDQQRARYLPLDDQTDLAPAPVSRMNRLEGYALLGLACLGLATTGAVLVFSLLRAH